MERLSPLAVVPRLLSGPGRKRFALHQQLEKHDQGA
jgi:hypothetical protein